MLLRRWALVTQEPYQSIALAISMRWGSEAQGPPLAAKETRLGLLT